MIPGPNGANAHDDVRIDTWSSYLFVQCLPESNSGRQVFRHAAFTVLHRAAGGQALATCRIKSQTVAPVLLKVFRRFGRDAQPWLMGKTPRAGLGLKRA